MLETRSLYWRVGDHLKLKGMNLLSLQIEMVMSELLTDNYVAGATGRTGRVEDGGCRIAHGIE